MDPTGNIGTLLSKQFENSNYLPRKIELEDISMELKKLIEGYKFSVMMENGIKKEVPIIYINQEMWAERKVNWKAMRNERGEEATRPFIAMSRIVVKKGTSPQRFTVPNKKKFSFVRIPTFNGTTKGIEIYKVPQPTYVDVLYELRFVTHYQEDIDDFYEMMIDKIYSSGQAYLNVNGYYIASKIEDPSEENDVDDFSSERVYQIVFPITVHGKLINPLEFEKVNTINKVAIKLSEGVSGGGGKTSIEPQGNIGKLLDKQFENSGYLPRKIELEDVGIEFKKLIEGKNFSIMMENGIKKEVPLIYINQEMWAERKVNWKAMRNERGEEVTRPFIAMSRTGVKRGTAPARFTIPNKKKFSFVRIPVFDGTMKGIEIYKIPQPTYVDVEYELRFVTHYQEDIDDFYEMMIDGVYSSGQAYLNVNGYYLASVMGEPSEDNDVDDFSSERVYQIVFPITVYAKLVDPKEFEKVNTINKVKVSVSEIGARVSKHRPSPIPPWGIDYDIIEETLIVY